MRAQPRAGAWRSSWSLNPYMGCVHRCTFCYVRAFEQRADRPSDDRYGTLDPGEGQRRRGAPRELARPSWQRELVAIGAATDPYQPAEGRYRLTRGLHRGARRRRRTRSAIITRGPMIVRDLDVLVEAAARARRSASSSRSRRSTRTSGGGPSPATAHPRQRLRALQRARRRRDQGGRRDGADPARASPTDPSSSRRSSAPRARRARPGSGRICSSSSPGPGSTSSSTSRRDWPERARRATRSSTPEGPISRPSDTKPVRGAGRRASRGASGSQIGARRGSGASPGRSSSSLAL